MCFRGASIIKPTFHVDDIQLVAAPAPELSHLSVNATQAVRTVDARRFAVNTAIWDGNFDTISTTSLLREMGTRWLRCPGGSLSDEYHWSTDTNLTNSWRCATDDNAVSHDPYTYAWLCFHRPLSRGASVSVVQLQGQAQARYLIQSSTNLSAWTTVSTNALTGSTLNFTNPVPTGAATEFWRALWQP